MEKMNNRFNEEQLDRALDLALLDQHYSPETLETMATHIFAAAPAVPVPASAEKKLLRSLGAKPYFRYRFLLNTLLAALLGAAAVAGFLFLSPGKQKQAQLPARPEPAAATAPVATQPNEPVADWPRPQTEKASTLAPEQHEDTMLFTPVEEQLAVTAASRNNYVSPGQYIPEETSLPYEEIPVLTEAQKKQTVKDKLNILRQVGKKRVYSQLPSGFTYVNGVRTNVDAFAVKDAEITNLEYRTFLNDLLVQGRNGDYLLAKPVSGGWTAAGIPEFETVYFTNAAYNEFPAVNMTRKGAELYCEWLTVSFKAAVAAKDIKWSGALPDFRLPTDAEWIYAARGCDSLIDYPWSNYPHVGVQNARGCYLCNFNYSISKDSLHSEGPKGKDGCIDISNKKPHHAVLTSAGRSIDTLVTAPVTSYNPNTKGAYCMLGNVSEMVWTGKAAGPGRGEARSLGGSWYSHVSQVKIESAEQYVGVVTACAYIGFRPVMTFAAH